MNALFIYLLKASLSFAVFYGLHMLLMRNETLFKLRRIYFLLAAFFSLAFPFLTLSLFSNESEAFQIPMVLLNEIEVGANIVDNTTNNWGYMTILLITIITGSLLLTIRFFMQLSSILYMLKNKEIREYESCRLIEVEDESIATFSFFGWIIINVNNKIDRQLDDMIKHELVHAHQFHSFDVLLYEVLCIVFWWNPIMWLIKREVKLNLEYLADAGVQQEREDVQEYQYLLLRITNANSGVAIINNLNVSQLKKRIVMMNKKRSSVLSSAKYLLTIPLALFMMQANSVLAAELEYEIVGAEQSSEVAVEQAKPKEEPYTVVEKMPRYIGGDVAMLDYIKNNLKYPEVALNEGVEGRVICRFTVTSTGDIIDAKILRGLSEACDGEALRVVKEMPSWEPGEQNGKKVSVYFTLPIVFKLTKSAAADE